MQASRLRAAPTPLPLALVTMDESALCSTSTLVPGVQRGFSRSSIYSCSTNKWLLLRLTKTQALALLAILFGEFNVWASVSILPPLLTGEAASRGLSPTLQGWILGVYPLSMMLFCFILGERISKIDCRYLLGGGLFTNGFANILLGILGYYPAESGSWVAFPILVTLLRVTAAVGGVSFANAVFSVAGKYFKQDAVTVLCYGETACAAGFVIGPPIAGALFTVAGFPLPFMVLGGSTVCAGFLGSCCIKNTTMADLEPEPTKTSTDKSVVSFMRNGTGILNTFAVILSGILWSGIDPLLEPHLQVFNLEPKMLCLMFSVLPLSYMAISPVVGIVMTYTGRSKLLCTGGICMCALGYILLGPSPLLSTYNVGALRKEGFKDDIATYGMISSIWTGAFSAGDFIGPIVTGAGRSTVGIPWVLSFISAVALFMCLLILVSMLCDKESQIQMSGLMKEDEESEIYRSVYGSTDVQIKQECKRNNQ